MVEGAMDDLAARFEEHRSRLRGVAYRLLGSLAEADDAVQEAWLRLERTDPGDIDNLGAWLTTVVSRICLNMIRARREVPLDTHIPDPIVTADDLTPEDEAVLADAVGLALQVVIDKLSPAERVAFVLHDMFDVPFDEIAAIAGRTPDATRQLASRARRRVRATGSPDADIAAQRAVVDAFFTAARAGDMTTLVSLLDPDVVLRNDFGARTPAVPLVVRGAEAVAAQAKAGALPHAIIHPAVVNGAAGAVIEIRGRPFAVMAFLVVNGRIAELDVLADAERLPRIAAAVLSG
jgi:RNA polymerase sigma-70 factor (ECF subfamily)